MALYVHVHVMGINWSNYKLLLLTSKKFLMFSKNHAIEGFHYNIWQIIINYALIFRGEGIPGCPSLCASLIPKFLYYKMDPILKQATPQMQCGHIWKSTFERMTYLQSPVSYFIRDSKHNILQYPSNEWYHDTESKNCCIMEYSEL